MNIYLYFSKANLFCLSISCYALTTVKLTMLKGRSAETMRGAAYMRMLMANEEMLNTEFMWSMLILLAVAAAVCLFVHHHHIHESETEDAAREIMMNCGVNEGHKDRFTD